MTHRRAAWSIGEDVFDRERWSGVARWTAAARARTSYCLLRMALHFSEDPTITEFVPDVAATARLPEAYVWALVRGRGLRRVSVGRRT
jgi:hypothetical protein